MKLTPREYVILLLQGKTQKQLAKELGISERTIRRIKNESLNHSPRVIQAVEKLAKQIVKRSISKSRKPETQETKRPVNQWGKRRDLRKYKGKKWTGEYYKSDWILFDVSFLSKFSLLELIQEVKSKYREGKKPLISQFVLSVFDPITNKKRREVSRSFDINSMSKESISTEINRTLAQYKTTVIAQFAILVPIK